MSEFGNLLACFYRFERAIFNAHLSSLSARAIAAREGIEERYPVCLTDSGFVFQTAAPREVSDTPLGTSARQNIKSPCPASNSSAVENTMKKIARSLSTRTRPRPTIATSPSAASSTDAGLLENVRKGSMTSPIPPNTVIHFPECPHNTPPTPRPAYIPTALRTEIVEPCPAAELASAIQNLEMTGAREDIVPEGLDDPAEISATSSKKVQIRQYFASPTRCLDCSFTLAHEREAYLHEQSAGTLRELELRAVELNSAVRAICQLARTKNGHDGEPDGRLEEDDIEAIEEIEKEEKVVEESATREKERVDKEVRMVWEGVKKEWEGGIREIVRDDGAGESEERCVFVFPWEDVPGEEEGAEGVYKVEVRWIPIDE